MTDALVDSLARLSFEIQETLAEVAADHDLTVAQLRLLGILRDRTPLMQELAHHLGLDKSSTTGLVSRAERRGLVARTPAAHDRRAVEVSLTETGSALALEGAVEIERRVTALAAVLSAPDRATLERLARTVVDHASR